jgi:hypothetical protein
MRQRQVRCLLMGGQACVFYGAAEFSRDTDLAVLPDPENLAALQSALDDLGAKLIAVPAFDADYLHRGQAIHFRCTHPECSGLRVDIMSVMRNVDPFHLLWERRTTLENSEGQPIDLLSLPDLVKAKKTQRDKDWPMVRRLVESNYFQNQHAPTPAQLSFWLSELRTPELLIALAHQHPTLSASHSHQRPLLVHALSADPSSLETALFQEEAAERKADRLYWEPLKRELEHLRRNPKS